MTTPANIKCEHCRASIEADSKFCAECGNKLSETPADQSQKQSEPPRKNRRRSTSTALTVAGIFSFAVLAVLFWYTVGSLMFRVVQTGNVARSPAEQVLQKARAEIESKLIHCGDAWYSRGSPPLWGRYHLEMKGIDVRIKPEELTQADKANGIEWKGSVIFDAELYREHDGKKWGSWRDGREVGYGSGVPIFQENLMGMDAGVFRVEVKGGQYNWDYKLKGARRPKFDCENIPK